MKSYLVENREKFKNVLLVLDDCIKIANSINVSNSAVSNWCNLRRTPCSENLEKLFLTYKGKKIKIEKKDIIIERPEDMGLIVTTIEEDTLGKRLKKLLHENDKMSQTEFAEKMGVKKSHISNIIKDRKEPSYELIKKMSSYFDISIDFLVKGDIRTLTDFSASSKLSENSIYRINRWLNPPRLFKFISNSVYDIDEMDTLNYLIENSKFFEIFTKQIKAYSDLCIKIEEFNCSKKTNMKNDNDKEEQEQIIQKILNTTKDAFKNMAIDKVLKYNNIDITKIM